MRSVLACLVVLMFCPLLVFAQAPKGTEAKETDARLHADGKGWRLDKAKITDPKRPRVLLIGDSILNGYLKSVTKQLDGQVYIDAWVNPYNQSEHLNKLLAEVLAEGPYDLVHFNMGLHGWQKGRIKDGTFESLTQAYVEVIRAKLPKAKIIWASSTPVTVKGKPTELDAEINPIIVEHNRLAAKVMAELKVPVNDFYRLLEPKLELARGDQFHWKGEAYEILANTVVDSVRRELQLKPKSGLNLPATESRPNILIIVSDDHGYNDTGFQGGKDVPTPNLDRLAASGVRCTNGYVTHSFCSPTRAGLLTGRYQARFGHDFNPVYDPLDKSEGLPLTEKLLPQHLQEAEYRTAWIGKWHLGASPDHVPWKRGFQETYGFLGGGHMFMNWKPNERQYTLPLMRNGESVPDVPEHLTTALGREAATFVQKHQDQPWFLYLPFNAPHTPHQPTLEREQRFAHIADATRRKYLAQISLMDDAIGEAVTALADTKQSQRTLIFFFSDNGGPVKSGANNGLLRGQKGQLYEGGVRVPFLVSWPEKLPAGKTFDAPVSSLDVFATSLAVAGVASPTDRKYDGVNLVPYLTGELKSAPHERLHWRIAGGKQFAIREGNWKWIRQTGQPDELYDLATDPSEATNVATDKPEIVTQMTTALETWNKELVPPAFLGSSSKNEDWGPGGANQKQSESSKKVKQTK